MTADDEQWMATAIRISQLSPDPERKVGAVLVRNHRRLSSGFNRVPIRLERPGIYEDRAAKLDCVIHAEEAAIATAVSDLAGSTVYCTRMTCAECAKLIIAANVHRVVVPEWRPGPTNWAESFAKAESMYAAAHHPPMQLTMLPEELYARIYNHSTAGKIHRHR